MKNKFVLLYIIVMIAVISASCGAIGFIGHKPPIIKVSQISPKNISLKGFDLHVTLEIDNKSPGYITFTRAETNVHLEGKNFSEIEFKQEIKIEAEKKSYVSFKIPMTWEKIANLIGDYAKKEFLHVTIKGKAHFSEKWNLYLGYEAKIKVPAIKIVPVVDSFKLESLKFNPRNLLRGQFDAQAKGTLHFSLINHSHKIVRIKNFKLNIYFAGEKIAENVSVTPVNTDGKKTSYALVITLKPSKMLVNALRGNNLKIRLSGQFDLHSDNPLFAVEGFQLTLSDFITLIRR